MPRQLGQSKRGQQRERTGKQAGRDVAAIERQLQSHQRAGKSVAQLERRQSARAHVHGPETLGVSVSLVRSIDHAPESSRTGRK